MLQVTTRPFGETMGGAEAGVGVWGSLALASPCVLLNCSNTGSSTSHHPIGYCTCPGLVSPFSVFPALS